MRRHAKRAIRRGVRRGASRWACARRLRPRSGYAQPRTHSHVAQHETEPLVHGYAHYVSEKLVERESEEKGHVHIYHGEAAQSRGLCAALPSPKP